MSKTVNFREMCPDRVFPLRYEELVQHLVLIQGDQVVEVQLLELVQRGGTGAGYD